MNSVGILGGIAAGKSTITQFLISKGACHLDGDKIAHQVLEYPEVQQQIVSIWGNKIVDEHGKVIRKELAKIVFNDYTQLKILEDITWPLVNAKIYESFSRYNQWHTKILILDIPLLIETGWINLCNKIIFVDANEEDRIERFTKRMGFENKIIGKQELQKREQRQIPLYEKRKLATWIVPNYKDIGTTNFYLEKIWKELNESPKN